MRGRGSWNSPWQSFSTFGLFNPPSDCLMDSVAIQVCACVCDLQCDAFNSWMGTKTFEHRDNKHGQQIKRNDKRRRHLEQKKKKPKTLQQHLHRLHAGGVLCSDWRTDSAYGSQINLACVGLFGASHPAQCHRPLAPPPSDIMTDDVQERTRGGSYHATCPFDKL